MRLLPDDRDMGWTPYVWLIYLGYFMLYPVLGRAPVLEWVLTGAGLALFLALYFWGHWLPGFRKLWSVAGIAVLGFLFTPRNPGATVFYIYAAAFCGRLGRTLHAVLSIAGLLAVLAAQAAWLRLPFLAWFPAAVFSVLIGGINVHYAEVGKANARLRASQQEVERLAQTAERERIGRDLHDLLGHTLSLITLKAELARKLAARDPGRAAREMEEVEAISRQALREVREVVGGYRSEGLAAEMARARLALEAAGVKLEYLALPVDLDPAQETVLALGLREAVTNVMRHAHARICRITLEPVEDSEENSDWAGGTRLEVRDDGKGALNREAMREGTGLTSMRDRVEGLGGRLERHVGPVDGGTAVVITLPRRRPAVRTASTAEPAVTGGLVAEGAR
ncbi:MAG TPA: sensor histidine kinase [Thermoanaerobaculia bacterium]|jgi:two-component system sensor histidine kinase DesK|nr:sensor histidine kinase [Thermoanaerobaculia bacterium]